MTGPMSPRPTGPTHPGPASPGPSGPRADYPPPRIGQVIRDTERYLSQALATVESDLDPASLPPDMHDARRVVIGLERARFRIRLALVSLGRVAEVPLPPVGSAVQMKPPLATRFAAGEGRAFGLATATPTAVGTSPAVPQARRTDALAR